MKNKVFATILITSFFTFISPNVTQAYAGFLDTGINPVEAGTGITSAVSNTVTAGSSVTNAIMATLEKVKHYALDPLAWFAAKKIIQNLTAQTVNWINSGFKGNPAYIQDPGRFFSNIADNTASKFLSDTGLNVICSPFRAKVRLALVENYLSESKNTYSCSLGDIAKNYDNFINDFNKGGWDTWYKITQIRQNNPIGAYMAAKDSLTTQIGTEKAKFNTQLQWGKGFLSYEKCPKGQELDPAMGTGDCMVQKETVTPGSVIETQLESVLPTGIRQLELANSFNEIVGALITQMLTRVVGGGGNNGGLASASSVGNAAPSLTSQLVSTETGPSSTALPVIALNGGKTVTVRLGYVFKDPGYTAYDSNLGDLTEQVVVTNDSGGAAVNTCKFEPFLNAVKAAQSARNYNGVAISRWTCGFTSPTKDLFAYSRCNRTDRDRLGDLSDSSRQVLKYFQSVLEASKVLNPKAPRVDLMKQQIGKILPPEQLISENAMSTGGSSTGLSQGYNTGKTQEAVEKLTQGGLFLVDDISNQFTVITEGIASNPALYCAAAANPPLGSTEGTFTVTYSITTANGTASTTRTVIVSATAPAGQNDVPIDNLVGGEELQGGECAPKPTDAQRSTAQAAMDSLMNNLNSNLSVCPQGPYDNNNPPPQACQDFVNSAVNEINNSYPGGDVAALYYPPENTVGMAFTYVVGPNTNKVSNIIGPGDTWRGTFRVFCP